jgi:REP element-mobilizing transposase RayT
MGRALLQSERNATLWIDLLRSYVAAGRFQLHDFVIMPDHVHLLITVSGESTMNRRLFVDPVGGNRFSIAFMFDSSACHCAV